MTKQQILDRLNYTFISAFAIDDEKLYIPTLDFIKNTDNTKDDVFKDRMILLEFLIKKTYYILEPNKLDADSHFYVSSKLKNIINNLVLPNESNQFNFMHVLDLKFSVWRNYFKNTNEYWLVILDLKNELEKLILLNGYHVWNNDDDPYHETVFVR